MPGLTRTESIGGGGVSAFTPADLTGIVHWWSADRGPKTGSPGAISQLNDRVGVRHLVQATGPSQPADNTRTINGKVVLDFAGDDEISNSNSPSVTTNGTAYVFWIGKVDTLAISDMLWWMGGFGATSQGLCLLTPSSSTGRLSVSWANGTTLESYSPTTPVIGTTNPHLVEAWVIGTSGGVNYSIDGTDAAGGTNTVGYGLPVAIRWFARGNTLNLMDGAGCEWGVVSGAVPNSTQRSQLRSYAQSYWGTA